MTEKMIRDAYCKIRTIDHTIPDDVLDFMKDAAIEKLNSLKDFTTSDETFKTIMLDGAIPEKLWYRDMKGYEFKVKETMVEESKTYYQVAEGEFKGSFIRKEHCLIT